MLWAASRSAAALLLSAAKARSIWSLPSIWMAELRAGAVVRGGHPASWRSHARPRAPANRQRVAVLVPAAAATALPAAYKRAPCAVQLCNGSSATRPIRHADSAFGFVQRPPTISAWFIAARAWPSASAVASLMRCASNSMRSAMSLSLRVPALLCDREIVTRLDVILWSPGCARGAVGVIHYCTPCAAAIGDVTDFPCGDACTSFIGLGNVPSRTLRHRVGAENGNGAGDFGARRCAPTGLGAHRRRRRGWRIYWPQASLVTQRPWTGQTLRRLQQFLAQSLG